MENDKPVGAKMVKMSKRTGPKLIRMVNDKPTSANMVKLENGKIVKAVKPVVAQRIGKHMLKQAVPKIDTDGKSGKTDRCDKW